MPDLAGDRLGGGAVVAGQHPDVETQRLQLLDCLARLGLEGVGDGDQAGSLCRRAPRTSASRPRGQARSPARQEAVEVNAELLHQRTIADEQLAAVDRPRCPCR